MSEQLTAPAPDQIKEMEPDELLKQYDRLIKKVVNRFKDLVSRYAWIDEQDLLQVASIALLEAQTAYKPDGDCKFITYAFNQMQWRICRALNIKTTPAGETVYETVTVSLDEPLTDDSDLTRGDTLQSDDEPLEEHAERIDTAARVREAVKALPDQQSEVIERLYLNDPTESRNQIARSKGVSGSLIGQRERKAFRTLRWRLKALQPDLPNHIGVMHFNSTWTSEPEQYVLFCEANQKKRKKEQSEFIERMIEK